MHMVDSSHDPAGQAPGTPRWVKALAIGAVVVILLVVAVMVIAGGQHGPFRHTPSGAADLPSPGLDVTQLYEAPTGGQVLGG